MGGFTPMRDKLYRIIFDSDTKAGRQFVLPEFVAAQRLYASFAFTPIEPISFNPVPRIQFLALNL